MNVTTSLSCSESFSGFLVLSSLLQDLQGGTGPGPSPNFWPYFMPLSLSLAKLLTHWISSYPLQHQVTSHSTAVHKPFPLLDVFCPSLAPPSLVSYSSFRPRLTIASSERPPLTCQAGFGSPVVQSQLLMLFHHGTYQSCNSVAFGLI